MSLLDLMRFGSAPVLSSEQGRIVARYKRLREVGRQLNNRLVARLSKEILDEGGRKLGILQGGVFVFDSEDETAVLMDYCLYDVRLSGRNMIEQYLIDSPPDADSDEMACLRAMQHAEYALFVVESVERGVGVAGRDLFSGEESLIIDIGLGATAEPGLVVATRILHFDDFSMMSGAALPFGVVEEREVGEWTRRFARASDAHKPFDPAPLIRKCLRQGSLSSIEYRVLGDPPEGTRRRTARRPQVDDREPARVSRNAPCPCGSGKKFKQCCLKRR